MRYITYLILFVICYSGLVEAQESRYRVEILVLQQLEYDVVAQEVTALDDFSSALDFLSPPPEAEAGAKPEEEVTEEAVEQISETEESLEEPTEPDPEELLNAVVHVPEMGPQMQDAWRRLRLSGPLRPLQYLAWEQGPRAPFPVLRVHDLEAVWTEDPWAEQRAAEELLEEQESPVEGGPNEEAQDPDADAEPGLPPPVVFYRLDGTASLTRSRFLHLRLTVEWREPLYDDSVAAVSPDGTPVPVPTAWKLFRLEQSRPIRTGRMEYFDGPVLGVLAWVTEVAATPASDDAAESQLE